MGALHKGHLALLRKALENCDLTGVSIFVNKRQFNVSLDYEKYPRDTERDLAMLTPLNPDFVFLPEEDDLFRDVSIPSLDLSPLDSVLEGRFRPGHFKGVVDVLWVFFTLIRPQKVFMGQKDLQQCAVVQRLIQKFFPDISLVIVPTVRDPLGLALSSRNERLSDKARMEAGAMARALLQAADLVPHEDWSVLKHSVLTAIQEKGFDPEYAELVSFPDFDLMTTYDPSTIQAICLAYYAEGVRLIDNALVPAAAAGRLFS